MISADNVTEPQPLDNVFRLRKKSGAPKGTNLECFCRLELKGEVRDPEVRSEKHPAR
jgi:hypothetical protein